jgi:integrase
LPIIGLYTGARPREICQLNPQCDYGEVDGVWHLSFNETTPAGKGVVKSIKTGETRHVPLHPELVRLGLPEYLARMKQEGADRLFPTFRVKGGNPYTVAGADFSELLRKVGLYDNRTKGATVTGMYVFRKTFATYGDEQGIKVEPFVGHREHGKSITQKHYVTRAKSVPLLFDAFKDLNFGVVIPSRCYVKPVKTDR